MGVGAPPMNSLPLSDALTAQRLTHTVDPDAGHQVWVTGERLVARATLADQEHVSHQSITPSYQIAEIPLSLR